MNNKINYSILAFAGGFFVDIINQSKNEFSNNIDYQKALSMGVKSGLIGLGLGTVKDFSHELEWSEANNKEKAKIKVWQKAEKAIFSNPYTTRKDKFGNIIHFEEYGKRKSDYGWEIDHSKPKSKGGNETNLNNLQPLHWRENAQKGNKYPYKKT